MFRLIVASFCYSFVPLVPYCYVRIYRFRKNQKKLGMAEEETKYRENCDNCINFMEVLTLQEEEKHRDIPLQHDDLAPGHDHHAAGSDSHADSPGLLWARGGRDSPGHLWTQPCPLHPGHEGRQEQELWLRIRRPPVVCFELGWTNIISHNMFSEKIRQKPFVFQNHFE